jgi:hypothetical protein
VDNRFEVKLLRREQRKSFAQIEARLRAENRERPGTSSIAAWRALFEDKPKQIVILAHAAF